MKHIFLLILVVISAFAHSQTLTFEDPVRYLALGDSYTIGQSVAIEDRFPVQLLELLKGEYNLVDAEVDIIAQTGWTTENLKAAIELFYDDSKEYNLVSLLIGVNNQYQNKNIDDYRPAFQELLETAIEIAGNDKNRVFVVSIPDYSYTPSHENVPGISDEIDDYNRINKDVAFRMGVRYVDITSFSRRGLKQPELVASDGLHPSGIQYAEWVQLIYAEFNKTLSEVDLAIEDTALKVRVHEKELFVELPEPGGYLSLFDLQGRMLKKMAAHNQEQSFPLESLIAGYYILNYELEDRNFSQKVYIN